MNVPKGYKMTEVGVIPEDWEVYRIGDIANVTRGASPRPIDSPIWFDDSSLIGWVRISDVTRSSKFLEETAQKLSILGIKQSRFVKQNSLIMSICATVGRPILTKIDVCIHDGFVVFSNLSLEEEYLYYLLLFIEKDWSKNGQIGSQMNLNTELINSTLIPIPRNTREQQSIARVLSDTDELINALDKLIAKKRDIKKAVMQELLTGKTRLPGFSGEWEVKKLGDHLEFLRNGVNSRAELAIDAPVKYLHYGDIHGSNSVFLNPLKLPSLPSSKASSLSRLKNGDLVFADASEDLDGVGKSVEITGASRIELVAGLHTIAVRFDNGVLADGFKAYLQFHPTFINQLRRLASGTKVYATNRSHIASIEINLPSIEEQQAIAQVLSDMDREITALEQRRDKTKALKQGMMQALLTGRIRLH